MATPPRRGSKSGWRAGAGGALPTFAGPTLPHFLRTSKLGTHDEVRGVAAGRADVFHDLGRVRIITEIKRELDDASFDALLGSYESRPRRIRTRTFLSECCLLWI